RLPVLARQRAGPAVEAEAGEEARLCQGPGHPGGPPGPCRLPHAAQAASVRRGAFLERPGPTAPDADEADPAGRCPPSTPPGGHDVLSTGPMLRVPLLCSAWRATMPAIDYRRARAELRLADVLELIGYQPRWRRGQQGRGPCPLHGSRTARSRSFAVHLGKNLFHCFRCGAGGNALDL